MSTTHKIDWTPKAIRDLVKRLGCSYADLARELRITEAAVRHWSNGTRSVPSMATLFLDELAAGKRRIRRVK